jgi:hypothetical protein
MISRPRSGDPPAAPADCANITIATGANTAVSQLRMSLFSLTELLCVDCNS